MAPNLIEIGLMAVACGTMATTITYSHITKPLRHAMIDAPFMLGELFSCPYCMAHWTALPAALALGGPWGNILISWMVLTGLSSLFIGVLLRLFLFREAENEELRETIREMKETVNELLEEKNE